MLDHAALLARLHTEAHRVSDLATDADLTTPVPSCPGWTARQLVEHLGSVHRWATEIVRTGERADAPAPPADPDALVPWYAEGAAALLEALARADPGSPCWGFGPRPRLAGFWARRQAHETAVHRWDLEVALGGPGDLDAELSADGVDEVVTMLFPRQVRLGRQAPLADALALVDVSGSRWVVTGDGTAPPTTPDATVTGPPDRLLLLLWRRIGLDGAGVSVSGDPDAARRVLGAALVP